MAVTAVVTSGLVALPGGLTAYSYEALSRMFECAESPCVDSVIALDTAANGSDIVLAAPGAGRALFIWAAAAAPNATGAGSKSFVLCDGATLATGAFHSIAGPASAANLVNPLQPVRKQLTANTALYIHCLSVAAATHNVRIQFCVV